MTDTTIATPASSAPPEFSIFQILPTLLLDVAVPLITFNVLLHYGIPVLYAIVAGGIWPALNNLRTWIRSRRLEPLGIIVITFMILGTLASLISGNVFFSLIKDSFLTGTFGLICLATLVMSRPLMFSVSRQFVAGDDPARIAWWNGLWDQYAHFRRGMRVVTAVWGITYIAEAFIRVGLAMKLTPAQVVNISPFMGFGALILLIVWTRRYMFALRDRNLRATQAA